MENVAIELVQMYGSVITECFDRATNAWLKRNIDDLVIYKKRTKSSFMWDFLINELRTEWYGNIDFNFIDRFNTTYIIYKQALCIKVKKTGSSNRPCFIKTGNASRFDMQQSVLLGSDFDLTNSYLCYRLNDVGTKVDKIELKCYNQEKLLWSVPVNSLKTITNELAFSDNQETKLQKRIKVKDQKQFEGETGNGSTV